MAPWRPDEHVCHMESHDIVNQVIDEGLLINFRRRLRRLTMIDKRHPSTVQEFKSSSAISSEEIRHMLKYYCMIHPFSIASLYWTIFMIFVYIVMFVSIPIHVSFPVTDKYFVVIIFAMHSFQLVDIILNFSTGYFDTNNSEVVMRPVAVTKHYLKTYFFFDFVSSLPSFYYLIFIHAIQGSRITYFFGNLFLLKIARMKHMLRSMILWRRYSNFPKPYFKSITLLLTLIIVLLWLAGIFHSIFAIRRAIVTRKITDYKVGVLQTLHMFLTQLFLVGYGHSSFILRETAFHTMGTVLLLSFGFFLQLYLLGRIHQIWQEYSTAGNKHSFILGQIKEYSEYKRLPLEMRDDLMSYFDYKYHKQFYKEREITKLISPELNREIRMDAAKAHIENVQIFVNLPRHVQLDIAVKLKSQIFMPNDMIMKAGEPGTAMYFIFTGTVAVYSPHGHEICHLEDGEHFGDVGLLFNEDRLATVVAVTPCELFKLKRMDFVMIMEPYEELMTWILAKATEKYMRFSNQSEREPKIF